MRRLGICIVLMLLVGATAASQESPPSDVAPDADRVITELQDLLKRAVARRRAAEWGGGIFTSCVEARVHALRQASDTARLIARGRKYWAKSPGFALRSKIRLRELSLYAKLLEASAEKCVRAETVAASLND